MKKIVILLFIANSFICSGQSWTYKSGGNTFDGKYKTCSVIGIGSDYPYTKPLLVINIFDESDLNFYISSSGYFSDAEDLQVYFALNGNGDNLYLATGLSVSDDGKIIFLSSFVSDDEVLLNYEMIKLLKTSTKLEVRIKGNYGKNDLKFSLSGSQKAINFVIPNNQLDKELILIQNIKEKLIVEKEQEELEIRTSVLYLDSLLNEFNIDSTDRTFIISRIKYKSGLKIEEIYKMDLLYRKFLNQFRIKLYDKNNGNLSEIYIEIPSITPK
tara:strand:+ start:284 stop:1096 length:813 start_codon:yes stop_codon:yes gene_type:complete